MLDICILIRKSYSSSIFTFMEFHMKTLTKILIVCMFFAANTCKTASSTQPTKPEGVLKYISSFTEYFGEGPYVATRTNRENMACRMEAWRSNDLARAAELRATGYSHQYHATRTHQNLLKKKEKLHLLLLKVVLHEHKN